jgi:Putative zinc-finger
MSLMDHSEALHVHAAEKYLLGELPPELREEYEEHFFDCEECASDVTALAAFAGGARATFRNEHSRKEKEPAQVSRIFAWLRPAIAAPALAALLLIVGYQSLVTIPRLKRASAVPGAHSADLVSLIGANSRSEGGRVFLIQRDHPTILEIDIPPAGAFNSFVCQIQDAGTRIIYQHRVSKADARETVHLIVPAGGLPPATYTLVVLGEGSATGSSNEVERLKFTTGFVD